MHSIRVGILILIVMFIPLKTFSMLDDTDLRLEKQFNIPLRWDNVEDEEPWLDGVKPVLNKGFGFHTVTLRCNEYITLRLYNGEPLRIYNLREGFKGDELEISLSNGSGIYITYPYNIDVEQRSILLNPPERIPYLIRIENPCRRCAEEDIEIALFVLRHEYLDDVAPYRDFIELPLDKVRIQQTDKLPSDDFYLLMPYEPVSVKVEGGAGFSLESRFIYGPNDIERLQPYHIEVRLDGMLFKTLDHESLPVITTPVYVNGREAVVGRKQDGFMIIPEGEHEIEIESDAPVYIRLLRRDEPDYLFTSNEPYISARDVRLMGIHPILRESLWGINEYDTFRLINNLTPSITEVLTNNLIKDNRLHEPAITGTMLLRQVSRDNPKAEDVARLSYLSHTFYRDIMPDRSMTTTSQRFFYFVTPSLREITQPEETILHPQHLEDAISILPSSIFTTLIDGKPLIYPIPAMPSPSFIRIIVNKETMGSSLLMVGFDDSEPLRIRLFEDDKLSKDDFIRMESEMALGSLSSHPYPIEPPTLSGRFSVMRLPSPIINAGYIDIPLPEKTRVIKLWKIGYATPMVALQYRTSRNYSLSQSSFMRYIKSMALPHNLIINLLKDGESALSEIRNSEEWGFPFIYKVKEGDTLEGIFLNVMGLKVDEIDDYIERFNVLNPDIDIDDLPEGREIYLPIRLMKMDNVIKLELLNDLLPFYYLLKANAKGFMATISREEIQPTEDMDITWIKNSLSLVSELYMNRDYIKALETLQSLIQKTGGIERDSARLLQADILKASGEHFLMENVLKGIFIYSEFMDSRQKAFDRLSAYYREIGDTEGLIGLFSASLLREPDLKVLPEFLKILLEEGEYEMVLKVGLLLPDDIQPTEILLRACIELSWWQAFDTLIERVESDEERNLWMAKRMLKEGRIEDAIKLFKGAGEDGKRWYEWLIEADSIYRGFRDCDDIKPLIERWQEWQAGHPGPFKWRLADELIRDSSGGVILYNSSRNLYSRMFLSTEGKKAGFMVSGPSSLKIEIRPLYESETMTPFNGWIEFNDNGLMAHYPIIDNLPSDALTITGDNKSIVGKKIMLSYDVGSGSHTLEVYSKDIPLLIKVYEIEPELRIPILPPINSDTLSAIASGCGEQHKYLLEQIRDRPVPVEDSDIRNRDIVNEMIGFLWDAEHNDERFEDNLVKAEALFLKNRHIPTLKRVIGRFYKKTTLVPFQKIIDSGGIRIREAIVDTYAVPDMRVRASMLSPLLPGEHLLYGYERIVIDMKNLKEKPLEVRITAEPIAYLPLEETEIYFELDGERVREIPIGKDDKNEVMLHLVVGEGEHYLVIGISKPIVNQFLRVRIWERQGQVDIPLVRRMEKRYFLATTEKPVVLAVEGPLILYIEKIIDDEPMMSYTEVEEGVHILRFYPEPSHKEALFRFYKREVITEKPSAIVRRFVVEYRGFDMPEVKPKEEGVITNLRFEDKVSLGSQEDGTMSLTGAIVRRRQIEAEERREDFLELRFSYRYFDELMRTQRRYEVLGRIREDGGSVLGFIGHIAYRPLRTPYNLDIDSSVYLQKPSSSGKIEYSINLEASIMDKRDLGTKTYHMPSITPFLRILSMDDYKGYMPEDVDQDVFTTYKADHRYGLIFSDTLYYMPWLDSLISIGGKVVTNEDMNPFSPDHLSFEAKWRQLIKNLQINLSYQENHYLMDDDRPDMITTRRLMLEASFEKWLNLNKRLEGGLRLIKHLRTGEISGMLYISLHLGKGRGYRDFHYGEIDFLNLRQMHISYEDNNQIIEDRR